MLSRGFIFRLQALYPVAAESDQKRHAYCTIRKVRAWNLQRRHGQGARRTSYRPGAPGSLPVLQLRYVVRLEFSGSFGPMQRGAEPRCRGAPNWIVHNTNHWGAVRPNMIPGKIRVPTLIVHAKRESSGTMTLPLPGSERRAAQEHFLRSYDRVEKELVRWRWRGTGCSCSAR